jgi:hypothetical protein
LAADFEDGTRLIALLIYFGFATASDLSTMAGNAQEPEQIAENAAIIERLLLSASCPLLLSTLDFCSWQAVTFDLLSLQLDIIWHGHKSTSKWKGLSNCKPSRDGWGSVMDDLIFKEGDALQVEAPLRDVNAAVADSERSLSPTPRDNRSGSALSPATPDQTEDLSLEEAVRASSELVQSAKQGAIPRTSLVLEVTELESGQYSFASALAAVEEDTVTMPMQSTRRERGETRIPGCAEELAWLFHEDLRRTRELACYGAYEAAAQNDRAALEAAKATADAADSQSALAFPLSPSSIQGTTSIDARVVSLDSSHRPMFVQTAVVDRTGTSSNAADDAAFVLELRDRQFRAGAVSTVCAQIDVAMISSIQQMSTAAFTEPSMDLSFIVRFPRTAILSPVPAILLTEAGVDATDDFNTYVFLRSIKAGDEVSVESIRSLKKQGLLDEAFRQGWLVEEVEAAEALRQQGIFLDDAINEGNLLLHFIVGPSAWRRRDGIRFFDELRILMHFVAAGVPNAAASIGAAAGAAAADAIEDEESPPPMP